MIRYGRKELVSYGMKITTGFTEINRIYKLEKMAKKREPKLPPPPVYSIGDVITVSGLEVTITGMIMDGGWQYSGIYITAPGQYTHVERIAEKQIEKL